MTQTQHTPGPWIALHNTSDDCYDVAIDEPDGYTFICDTRGPEAKANARLIAAAPDLLAACREVVADPDSVETLKQAEAAIDKATKPK